MLMLKEIMKKRLKTDNKAPLGAVLVGGFGKKLGLKRRAILIAFVCVALIVLTAAYLYQVNKQLHPSAKYASSKVADFSNVSRSDAEANIAPALGMSKEDLMTKSVNSGAFPTFEKSYNAAKALLLINEPGRALELYKLAGSQIGSAKMSKQAMAEFHLDYAVVAFGNNDKSTGAKEIALAEQNNQSSGSNSEEKRTQASRIQSVKEQVAY
jgi:hypothetical protein